MAIIPARGGSKRIPKKNIRVVAGRPLLSHVIDIATRSSLFEVIHVSTDDDEVADVAEGAGVPVLFRRAQELSDDDTPLEPVLRWTLAEFTTRGYEFDVGCILLATAALLTPDDLAAGVALHETDQRRRPVLAVGRFPAPIERALSDVDGVLRPRDPLAFARRSQDFDPMYYDTGTFTVFNPRSILEQRHAAEGFLPFVLPPWKAVDVDVPQDLEFLERLITRGPS